MAELVANFTLSEGQEFDALFEINAAGTTWGSIDGNISNQTDLYNILESKADKTTVQADLEAINETITENYTTLDTKIDTTQSELTGDISALTQTVTNNNTAINSRVDGIVDSFDEDIEGVNTAIQNEATQRAENDSLLQSDINTLSDNLASEISNRESADSGLQTQITNLSGTVSSNYTTLDNKIDGVNTSLQGDINTLETTVNSNYTTLNIKIDNSVSEIESDIETLSGTVSTNYTDLNNSISSNVSTLNNRIDSEVSTIETSISNEATTRENADNNLQSQIDAITAASDVVDIVGTYAQLQAYNTSNLQNNDIIKVLSDESRDDETTYYRWVITDGVGAWSFIGEEGPYYTKSEADSQFVPQTRTINNKPLSTNITLSASDIGALPDDTVIGAGTLTIQKNGVNVDSFSANATADKSINIEVPTTTAELTNNSGFITNSALDGYATTEALTNGLETKQNTLTPGDNVQINNNVISATDTTYTAGSGISIDNNEISTLPNMGAFVPDTTDMKVLETHEFDVSSTVYRKLFSFANNFENATDIYGSALIRVTVTGVNINTVSEIVYNVLPTSASVPQLLVRNMTHGATAARSGIRYLRCVYPLALNNGYDYELTMSTYNSTARHVKIEVLNATDNIQWYDSATPTSYNSTGQKYNQTTLLTTDGLIWSKTLNGSVSSATYANYINTYISRIVSSGVMPNTAEVCPVGFVFLGADGLHPVTNTEVPIIPGFGIFRLTGEYQINTTPTITYVRSMASVTSLTTPHDTFTIGTPCYLRFTMDDDGNIYSDNYITTTMSPGYTYLKLGDALSENGINMNLIGQSFISLDSEGNISHINGDAIGGQISTDDLTITKNTSDEIQAVGVIDSNAGGVLKSWSGTRTQYDAIEVKDANTLYNITDDTDVTLTVLEALYPVGAIYIGTMAACPLEVLGVGTWQLTTSRFLVDSQSLDGDDSSWYNLYSDGYCEQGGRFAGKSVAASSTTQFNVVFPKAYKDINYTPTVSVLYGGAGYANLQEHCNTLTATGMFINFWGQGGAGSVGCSWTTYGYTSEVSDLKQWRRIA